MTVGFVEEKEGANVGVQENALGLGKVAEDLESPAKTVISYCRYREEMNPIYSVKRTKRPKADLPACK